jgi:CO/xanthine dehydrogenase Mo-binding subunit
VRWTPLDPILGVEAGLKAPALHPHLSDNVLIRGRVAKGDLAPAFAAAAAVAEGEFRTSFVEHAYIEPEAGYARRVGERIEIVACTQTPYMDRDEIALVLGLKPERVRVIPTAVGGGFGGKLDLSLQPLIATAAWLLNVPVGCVYTRPESMASTTKRHPATIRARAAADANGKLLAFEFHGDFDTGAYASWGPTVANRVPVHAMGPYLVPAVKCTSAAIHTNGPSAGAFRGFGVPQAAIAQEQLYDELALKLGIDPLEFRRRNALRRGMSTSWTRSNPNGANGAPPRKRATPRTRCASAASGSPACGTGSATRRCRTPRPCAAVSPTTARSRSIRARWISARARTRS